MSAEMRNRSRNCVAAVLVTVVVALATTLATALATPAFAQISLPTMELTAGFHRLQAEVAATPEHRAVGLMHRQSMPAQHGMLFVFTHTSRHCMWMRNTLLPLSVAFLDEKGVIINIEDMQPKTETNHCAAKDARYALEMNLGWFKAKGVAPGMVIAGVERAPAGR
jgi:uncharacterized membrane protein (UPF0127 family)